MITSLGVVVNRARLRGLAQSFSRFVVPVTLHAVHASYSLCLVVPSTRRFVVPALTSCAGFAVRSLPVLNLRLLTTPALSPLVSRFHCPASFRSSSVVRFQQPIDFDGEPTLFHFSLLRNIGKGEHAPDLPATFIDDRSRQAPSARYASCDTRRRRKRTPSSTSTRNGQTSIYSSICIVTDPSLGQMRQDEGRTQHHPGATFTRGDRPPVHRQPEVRLALEPSSWSIAPRSCVPAIPRNLDPSSCSARRSTSQLPRK